MPGGVGGAVPRGIPLSRSRAGSSLSGRKRERPASAQLRHWFRGVTDRRASDPSIAAHHGRTVIAQATAESSGFVEVDVELCARLIFLLGIGQTTETVNTATIKEQIVSQAYPRSVDASRRFRENDLARNRTGGRDYHERRNARIRRPDGSRHRGHKGDRPHDR